MQLKTLLREFIENRPAEPKRRWDFLPNFENQNQLPVSVEDIGWELTDDLERSIKFETREDLQDFINAYLELEDETGVFSPVKIEGFVVTIASKNDVPKKFIKMVEEIAHEIRGY